MIHADTPRLRSHDIAQGLCTKSILDTHGVLRQNPHNSMDQPSRKNNSSCCRSCCSKDNNGYAVCFAGRMTQSSNSPSQRLQIVSTAISIRRLDRREVSAAFLSNLLKRIAVNTICSHWAACLQMQLCEIVCYRLRSHASNCEVKFIKHAKLIC